MVVDEAACGWASSSFPFQPVNRKFTVDAPCRMLVTDITEYPTAESKLYYAVVINVYSRLIIGWPMTERS